MPDDFFESAFRGKLIFHFHLHALLSQLLLQFAILFVKKDVFYGESDLFCRLSQEVEFDGIVWNVFTPE